MKKIILLPVLLILTSCQTVDPAPTAQEKVCAADDKDCCPITKIDTRKEQELCQHFAGEDPYNAERAAFIKRKMQELNCEFYNY